MATKTPLKPVDILPHFLYRATFKNLLRQTSKSDTQLKGMTTPLFWGVSRLVEFNVGNQVDRMVHAAVQSPENPNDIIVPSGRGSDDLAVAFIIL